MSWSMLWPVLIVVLSNVFYHICQKSTPEGVNAFAAMSVTYLIGAAVTALIFTLTAGLPQLGQEVRKLNWASFALGVIIVGLEIGSLFLYRAGWKVSIGSLVCNIALAVVLVFVGALLYREHINARQLIGMVLCTGGLILLTL